MGKARKREDTKKPCDSINVIVRAAQSLEFGADRLRASWHTYHKAIGEAGLVALSGDVQEEGAGGEKASYCDVEGGGGEACREVEEVGR